MSPLLLHSNTNPYNINGLLCTYTNVSYTDMLQPDFISCRGVSGAVGNKRGSGFFCQFYLVLSLFYSLQGGRGPMVLLLRKLYLYFTKDPEGVHYFPGGCQTFSRGGVQMLISLETHNTYLLFSRGEGWCPDPLSSSGTANGQCHHNHNGTIFITVPLLTIIVRHWFVRINDR